MCAKPRAPPPERTTPSARPTSRRARRPAPGSLGSVVASRWWARGWTASSSARSAPPDDGPRTTRSASGEASAGGGLSAVATSSVRSAWRAQRSLQTPAPASSTRSTCAFSSSARSTALVPAASASEQLDGAVRRQRVRQRRGHSFEWHAGIEPPQGDERRPGGGAARPPLACSCAASSRATAAAKPGIPLHQLDEPPAAELQQGRVADRLDGRRPRGTGEQRELADGRARAEDTQRPPVRVDACHGPQAPAQDDVEVLGIVPFADEPLAGEHAARVGVGRERLERLRVRAGEERDARQRGAGDSGRAQGPPRRMRRSYAVGDSPIARFVVSFDGARRDGVWRHAAGVGRRAARAPGARDRRGHSLASMEHELAREAFHVGRAAAGGDRASTRSRSSRCGSSRGATTSTSTRSNASTCSSSSGSSSGRCRSRSICSKTRDDSPASGTSPVRSGRGVPHDRRARGGAPGGRLPARPRALDGALPRARAREAAAARGRGRRRQDRGGEVARRPSSARG